MAQTKKEPTAKPKQSAKIMVIGCNGNTYRITGQNIKVNAAYAVEVERDDQVNAAIKAKLIRIF